MTEKAEQKRHYQLLFPSKYLKAADLGDRQVTVTIEKIVMEELAMRGGRKERKPVITLKGKKKRWVLNRTNADAIAKLHGNYLNDWCGKEVTLCAAKVQFGSQVVDAVRVTSATNNHDPDTGEVMEEGDFNE